MIWMKEAKTVSAEGTTIRYRAYDAGQALDLYIESQKRHKPHANGIGTWDSTNYHVFQGDKEIYTSIVMKRAKEFAEGLIKKEGQA